MLLKLNNTILIYILFGLSFSNVNANESFIPKNNFCEYFPSPVQTWNSKFGMLSVKDNAVIENAPDGKYVGFYNESNLNVTDSSCGLSNNRQKCITDNKLMSKEYNWKTYPVDSDKGSYIIKDGVMILSPGIFESLPTNISGKYKFKSGEYWIRHITLAGREELDFDNEKVILNVESMLIAGEAKINNNGSPDNLNIIQHSLNGQVSLSSENFFNALIISRNGVFLSGNVILKGAVTSSNITISGNSKIIGESECFGGINDKYDIEIIPYKSSFLMCDNGNEFIVKTKVNDFYKKTKIKINISPSEENFRLVVKDKIGEGKYPYFSTNNNGMIKFNLSIIDNDKIKPKISYKIIAEVINDSDVKDGSVFNYVPYKFLVENLNIIAGKKETITTKVLACDNDNFKVFKNYIGKPSIELGLISPIDGSFNSNTLNYNPEFASNENGVTKDFLTIYNSGIFNVRLEDENFNCSGLINCPISGKDKLNGSFIINSRPWKIPICGLNSKDKNADSSFIASGDLFDFNLRPILYNDESIDICKQPMTTNYLIDGSVDLNFSVNYPNNGSLGNLKKQTISKNNSNVDTYLGFHVELFWTEVGEINITSSGLYNGVNIDSANIDVGRFYPAYFLLVDNLWDYPDNQGSDDGKYIYMDQFFDNVSFKVKAYNSVGSTTKNYGLFDNKFKASFELIGEKSDRLNFSSQDLQANYWEKDLWHVDNLQNVIFWKKTETTPIKGKKVTVPDGPYNMSGNSNAELAELKLKVKGIDPVYFNKERNTQNAFLINQPDIRYGRMALSSVTGLINTPLNIPIRAEYWDGTRFSISYDDNKTKFDGSKFCRETIWNDEIDSINALKLKGKDKLYNGENNKDLALTGADKRQQVMFWLLLSSNKPNHVYCESEVNDTQSWLEYNWRNFGDEAPSSVVTLGPYNGDDRILYRVEPIMR